MRFPFCAGNQSFRRGIEWFPVALLYEIDKTESNGHAANKIPRPMSVFSINIRRITSIFFLFPSLVTSESI